METNRAIPTGFPHSPKNRHGWPWDAIPEPSPAPDSETWPKISIVTPSFNQGEYIEETIRSVLLQGYPNLEYIIIDGGSSDQTLEIIKKYEVWISSWVSENDRGQTHAINKGFALASGDIVAWLNSDDVYVPHALQRVAEQYRRDPGGIILGDVEDFYQDGSHPPKHMRLHNVTPEALIKPLDGSWFWHQPGTFVPMQVQKNIGELDESLKYAFDKDWIFRLLKFAPVRYLNEIVVRFRIHVGAKTSIGKAAWIQEIYLVNQRYLGNLPDTEKADMISRYHLILAGLYLCEHKEYLPFFSRTQGVGELLAAMRATFKIMRVDGFWSLVRRLLLPRLFWRSR